LALGFFENNGKPLKEGVAVLVVTEDLSFFYSPGLPDIGFVFRRGGRAITCWRRPGASSLGWRGIGFFIRQDLRDDDVWLLALFLFYITL